MDHSNRLEQLISEHENALLRAAAAILGDIQEAEDAVQDTFLKYLEKRPSFRDGNHARAWLLKVTANGCLSRLRDQKRHPTAPLLEAYPAPTTEHRELMEAVMDLPPHERAVIHLHYYEGYSTEEIARMLGCRPGTVRSRLSRSRETLRLRLKGAEF